MTQLTKSLALVAFTAFVIQASLAGTVSAQSSQKTMKPMKTTQQGSAMKSGSGMKETTMKETMSRAFTNNFNVPSLGVALEGYCPVCYIAANKAAKGKAKFSADHNGITYWFVSDDVRKVVVANPEKSLPAYGG